jgi:hypothetical protein
MADGRFEVLFDKVQIMSQGSANLNRAKLYKVTPALPNLDQAENSIKLFSLKLTQNQASKMTSQ